MNTEKIRNRLNILNNDRVIQNLIAQANARYILLNTGESAESFPPYTIDDIRLNLLAFQYLNLGCCLIENDQASYALDSIEKGAGILEAVHGSSNNQQSMSNYYGIIAALSYYVSFQYSKSFILINKFKSTTTIARLIQFFLLRDFYSLNSTIYEILVSPEYSDEVITEDSEEEGLLKIYELVIAKSLDGFVKYLQTGNQEQLFSARERLFDLKEIASLQNDPGIWWVIRLLLLVSDGFSKASIWNVLRNYFDVENQQVKGYLRSLVFMQPRGVYEFFITQRNSLPKVLSDEHHGCVVSIPTSSGKTRIAEMAILDSVQKYPECKILYIAPFRSLAYEIENSMERVFENAGIVVSHLYGGSNYSKLDEMAIEEASLIIATPEKAKAILRGNDEFINQIHLVIVDEGHLLGDSKRLIVNEIFYEELRYYVRKNNGKFLLLSAVLPNPEDLSAWLAGSEEKVYRGTWRPSDERLGILEWNNGVVNLKWESQDAERPSFNNRFIVHQELPWKKRQRKAKYFPGDKNEAVASTAFKLRSFGPVLIFVGRKDSVFVMGKAYLKALGHELKDHQWKSTHDWRAFELACLEAYGEQKNKWLDLARKGILCHNADLHADVRLPLERLMRNDKPLVIISTSTLGQGVNLGVSTVIFSTLTQSGRDVNARDFWNIAGRAGRAFVDHEGKILVARETTGMRRYQRDADTKFVRKFFDKEKIDVAKSGILILVKELKNIASENGIDFDLLLTLIAENKIDKIGANTKVVEEVFDWIDDTVLSLMELHNPFGELDVDWTEEFFGKCLATIQTKRENSLDNSDVFRFFRARAQAIAMKVGEDRDKWRSIIKSGIPLVSDLMLEEKLMNLLEIVRSFNNRSSQDRTLVDLLSEIESEIKDLPVLLEQGDFFKGPEFNRIKEKWLEGETISNIFKITHGEETITHLYTYTLPWVLNGISKKLRNLECNDEATILEELSILVEVGLPSILKVKIYQAGIRSRVAANELGELFEEEFSDKSINWFRKQLLNNIDYYIDRVTENTGEWLRLLSRNSERKYIKIKKVTSFEFKGVHKKTTTLLARNIKGKQYLISPDLNFVYKGSGDIDFSAINNIPGIEFVYSDRHGLWRMRNNNPYVELE